MFDFFTFFVKADLHGTSFAYDNHMRLLLLALFASGKTHIHVQI